MSDGYQGWSNYSSWCTALWLDNDQGDYSIMVDKAKEYSVDDGYEFGQWIKEYVWEMKLEMTGLFDDLLTSALQEVDWTEIANHYLEEYHQDDEVDEDNGDEESEEA